jgi:HEAT repeat protein
MAIVPSYARRTDSIPRSGSLRMTHQRATSRNRNPSTYVRSPMGLPAPVWKLSTFASLGLAAFFALRPAHPAVAAARGAPAPKGAPAVDAPRSFWAPFLGQAPATAEAPPPDRTSQLLRRLADAHTVSETCSALDDLARVGDATAAQTVVDVTQRATRSDLRSCATSALGNSHTALAASWLEELARDHDTSVRDAALAGLAGSDDPAVRRVALGFAHADDPKLRLAALVALGAAHDADAAALLSDEVGRARGDDKIALIQALGTTRDPAALTDLTKMANDPSSDVRHAAISSLASAGGADAVTALEGISKGANSSDAALAIETLGQIPGDGAHAALLAAATDSRGAIASAAVMALADDSSDDVRAVLRKVATRPGPARGPALTHLLESPDTAAEARAILLHAINVDGGSSASASIDILGRDDSDEARAALVDIARRGGANGSEAVSALASREDPASRSTLVDLAAGGAHPEALEALGRAHDERALPLAMAAAKSDDVSERASGYAALAQLGGDAAAHALANAAASPDVETRRAVADAFSSVEESTPALRALANDADSEVARSAFGRLAILDPAQAETLMTTRLGSPDDAARRDAIWFSAQLDGDFARPYLVAALHDPSADVVADACNRLGDVGGADAQTALFAVMTNPSSSPAVAAAAASALEQTDGALAREQAAAIARYRDAPDTTAQTADETAASESAPADDATE